MANIGDVRIDIGKTVSSHCHDLFDTDTDSDSDNENYTPKGFTMTRTSYHWNAEQYAEHSSAQLEWATELIAKLNLEGNESVLDIGCGDGKITAAIAEKLPEGRVLGIDSSAEMIRLARSRFEGGAGNRLNFRQLDVREMAIEHEFDVIFSNAALHWVRDHASMLKRIARSMKTSGRMLIQMGGKGNAGEILSVFDRLMEGRWEPWFKNFSLPYGFHSPGDYTAWLTAVGLTPDRVVLIEKDMKQKGKEGLAGWIRTTWLPFQERIPEDRREEFIYDIVETYLSDHPMDSEGNVHVKMVRLEVEARKI